MRKVVAAAIGLAALVGLAAPASAGSDWITAGNCSAVTSIAAHWAFVNTNNDPDCAEVGVRIRWRDGVGNTYTTDWHTGTGYASWQTCCDFPVDAAQFYALALNGSYQESWLYYP